MSQKASIRPIQAGEIDQLIKISKQCFHQTFDPWRVSEGINTYIRRVYTREKLLLELEITTSKTFFASVDNQIVGYSKVNRDSSQTENNQSEAFEIQRIYVLKRFQGLHVGSAPMHKAISMAKEEHFHRVWLSVREHNDKVQKSCHYFGFKIEDEHTFMMGNTTQRDLMMVKDI